MNAPLSVMHSRQRITISSTPSLSPGGLPPTSRAPAIPQFRYEDRRSTLVIESDRLLSPTYLNKIFTLPDVAEGTAQGDASVPTSPISFTPALGDTQKSRASPHRRSHRVSGILLATPKSSPPGSPGPPKSPRPRQRVLFYHKHDPHYGFTNFSEHPVVYKGKTYPTSEHLFQSFKFQEHRPGLADHIRTCSERPSAAFSEARRFQPEVRPDWKHVNIEKMDITLEHKFTQHLDLKEELLATGDAELVEDSDKDAFWGVGADGKGRNELGKALERLREKLRRAHPKPLSERLQTRGSGEEFRNPISNRVGKGTLVIESDRLLSPIYLNRIFALPDGLGAAEWIDASVVPSTAPTSFNWAPGNTQIPRASPRDVTVITLEHKFSQHRDLQQELLAKGDAELVEDSDKDAFLGVGADGKGRNEVGKALERSFAKDTFDNALHLEHGVHLN
ncbi:hypothetical protein DXG03_001910 [Asterophora parasitica]|uniref:NADAR domain-containing protein n=1 Tax=Asterophora parasitica TaxID=117018 RepID=A0A9P7G684_9AGAR|nr:hypothetical protein DXG03_001910 [Asterophora parasitica]